MEALLQLEAKEAIPAIISSLKDNESTVRMAAINTLAELKAQEATSSITALLKITIALYVGMMEVLGLLQGKEALPGIISLLQDKDDNVRLSAIKALQDLDAKEVVPGIILILQDSNANIRSTAISLLRKVKARKNILHDTSLQDSNSDVQQRTISALEELQEQWVPSIIPLLNDNIGRVRLQAENSILRLQEKELIPLSGFTVT